MSLSDFDYILPPERIAQTPASPRDSSKLLIVDRQSKTFTDKHFFDLADLLTANDVLVINNTKVFPARLMVQTTKPIELLLEKEVGVTSETISWDALTKPGLKVGDEFEIPSTHVRGVCEAVNGYTRKITFFIDREHFFPLLDKWAKTPIPPYIKWEGKDEMGLRERYQTVFAKHMGAVAAPTAGLHFTPELMEKIKAKGVQIEEVTLHVGLGTFLPVKTDDIQSHHMHSEWFELSQPVASRLSEAKKDGKRIIAVGTTSVRVLETCSQSGDLVQQTGTTDIFIYPPYQFQFVDSIITNFHTPKSTLLMLVSAFVSIPNTTQAFSTFETCLIGQAYKHALENAYRFYSFGDSMWIT
ncbi:MAG: tRNA preQ1(34) S-adenosylmethionine ribosyltransferase-isomerase QueA [Candidatus Woesebacteria bacterium]